MPRRLAVLLLALLAAPRPAAAQAAPNGPPLSQRRIAATATTTPPVIDGDLSDPVWQGAPVADAFADGFNASRQIDQTEARILYDEEAVYVAWRCLDAKPDDIVSREIRRDSTFQGEDTVVFTLDPYRTRRPDATNYFIANALGTPASYIAGGRAAKSEWKGEWSAAAKRAADGWTAEMKIPWKALNVPIRSEPVAMGINFGRFQSRTQIFSQWSHIGPQGMNELAGDWEAVRVPRSAFQRSLSLLPYTTTGLNLGRGRSFPAGVGRGRRVNFGLDARLALTPELTGVGSLNPDFSTVERAVEGIDFTRGERFVPDTRPFFLEGGDVFDVTLGSWGDAFFSGRVPAFDAGAKLYGRYGPRDSLGVLATYGLGGRRSDMVGRWIHDVGPGSFIGGYVVQRALPGDTNTVLGLNELIRRGAWRLRSDVAASLGTESGGSAAATGLTYSGSRVRGGIGYTFVDPRFRAANGFVRFRDLHGPDFFARYEAQWRRGPIRSVELGIDGLNQYRTSGAFFRREVEIDAEVQTRGDWALRAGWEGGRFEEERDSEFSVGFVRNVSDRTARMGIRYSWGVRGDHPIRFIAPFISRRLFGKWDVSVSSSLLRHRESRSLHVVSIGREFSPTHALGGRVLIRDGYVQYFLSYRISGGRGLETYFLIGDPVGRARHSRTQFITKFVYPISL